MTQTRTAQQSCATSTRIVMPNETNTLGNLMGGQLLNWMDINAAIAAHRHCKRVVVTASVNNVSFNRPIRLGDIVTIESKVSRAFTSSMEIFSDVWVEDHVNGERIKSNESIYTFVAVDQNGGPIEVPGLIPETDLEKERYASALRRKQLSLILAKRMKPEDAHELKELFKV
ncbi:MAG: acyl-CoA thioesterase [Flavobacteriales bacterium]|nr:acyl-CoA thioesterase [Flavobacteriales bacterium]